MDEMIKTIITSYAQAIVAGDTQACADATHTLEAQDMHFAGYVGAPVLYKHNTVIAQVVFHYTKNNTLSKRRPYDISY